MTPLTTPQPRHRLEGAALFLAVIAAYALFAADRWLRPPERERGRAQPPVRAEA